MKKLVFVAGIIVLFAMTSMYAKDHRSSHKKGCSCAQDTMGCGSYLICCQKDLKLTQEQIDKITALESTFSDFLAQKQEEIGRIKKEIQQAHSEANPDFNALRVKLKQVNNLELQIKMEKINTFEAKHTVLNDEQKAMLPEVTKKKNCTKKTKKCKKHMNKNSHHGKMK